MVKLPQGAKKVHMSLHDVSCIYMVRFLREPASERLTSKQVEACFRDKMQASHLLENIPCSPMGINPLLMTLESGGVNRSRHTCVEVNSLQAFLEKHKNDPETMKKKHQLWQKELARQHCFYPASSSSYITFRCVHQALHNPPCVGWDYRPSADGKLPKELMKAWDKYRHKKERKQQIRSEELARRQHLTPRQALTERVHDMKKQLSSAESRLRAMSMG